jgi:hypothetical protein
MLLLRPLGHRLRVCLTPVCLHSRSRSELFCSDPFKFSSHQTVSAIPDQPSRVHLILHLCDQSLCSLFETWMPGFYSEDE